METPAVTAEDAWRADNSGFAPHPAPAVCRLFVRKGPPWTPTDPGLKFRLLLVHFAANIWAFGSSAAAELVSFVLDRSEG
jgi:hypothetical protein